MGQRETSPEYVTWLEGVRERVKNARDALKLSFRDAEEKTGVAFATIQKLESGKHDPSISTLIDLANGYGVNSADIIGELPFAPSLIGDVGAGTGVNNLYPTGERLRVSELFPAGVAAYRVRGDSMLGDAIKDGDYVIVRTEPAEKPGDRVIVWIGDEDVVLLKKLRADEAGQLWLDPVSRGGTRFRPRRFWSAKDHIYGVYVGVIRRER